jgi:L-threonylcarbamoyladenylate synthase
VQVELVPARGAAEVEFAARRAAEVLAAGGLVVHPTETVYGIGGDGSPENNALISRVKRRERAQPLILLAPDLEALRAALPGLEWPAGAEQLARSFWPGPLTLVVRCAGAAAGLVGPGGGVAVRITPDPTVAAILACWRRPMTSTSANLSGREPARTVEQALEVFAGRGDLNEVERPLLAVDAGTTRGAQPSTIVSLVEWPPRLIREGPVSRRQLVGCVPQLA